MDSLEGLITGNARTRDGETAIARSREILNSHSHQHARARTDVFTLAPAKDRKRKTDRPKTVPAGPVELEAQFANGEIKPEAWLCRLGVSLCHPFGSSRRNREFGGQGEGGADLSAKLEKHFACDLELLRFVTGPFLSCRFEAVVRICYVGNGNL